MVNKFNILLILLFLSVSFLDAQNVNKDKSGGFARIMSMGDNPFVQDPTDMFKNPAWGKSYDNLLFGDIGSTVANNFEKGGVGQYLGINFGISDQFTVGAVLTRKDFIGSSIAKLDPFRIVSETNSAIGSAAVVELDNNWEVMSSLSFGIHTLGLGVSYASTSTETKPAVGGGREGNASQFGLNFGYLANISPKINIDLSAYILFPSTNYKTPQSSQTKFSQSVFGIDGRAFYKLNYKFTLVPYFKLVRAKGTAEIGDQTGVISTDLPSFTLTRLGFGVNYRIDNFLFAGGPSYGYLIETSPAVSGVSPELSRTTTSFPVWNFGAEWDMLDWLTARIGYSTATNKVSTETTASPTNSNETIITTFSPFNGGFTLGLGFNFSGFSLHASVNEDVIRQGLNNIGGGGATFAYISANYAF